MIRALHLPVLNRGLQQLSKWLLLCAIALIIFIPILALWALPLVLLCMLGCHTAWRVATMMPLRASLGRLRACRAPPLA